MEALSHLLQGRRGRAFLQPPTSSSTKRKRSSSPTPANKRPRFLRTMASFETLGKIGKGAYGEVFKARDKSTGEAVAIKTVDLQKSSSLALIMEVECLISCRHPNVIEIKEVALPCSIPKEEEEYPYNPNPSRKKEIHIVMELMDRDLYSLLASLSGPLDEPRARRVMRQLFLGVAYIHRHGVLHRDIKTGNILVNQQQLIVKISDFGMSCRFDAGRPVRHDRTVGTLPYLAPELLLGAEEYTSAIDMWSLGCVMGELLLKKLLIPGKSKMEQLALIFTLLGAPDKRTWPGVSDLPGWKQLVGDEWCYQPLRSTLRDRFPKLSPLGFNLLKDMLAYDPKRRITAQQALRHPWLMMSS